MSSTIEVVYADESPNNGVVVSHILGGRGFDVLRYSADDHDASVDRLQGGGVLVVDVVTQHGLNFAERYRAIFEAARECESSIVIYTTSSHLLLKVASLIGEKRRFDLDGCFIVDKGELDKLIEVVRSLALGSVPEGLVFRDAEEGVVAEAG